jgi:hypothetical protein
MKTRFELEVEHDNDPMNPRTDWDNFTTMICSHRRYSIGDEHNYKSENFDSWEEMKEQILLDFKVLLIKPLYMYDHSGITIKTSSFDCRWDSGQIGWVFIDEKQWKSLYGEVEVTEDKLDSILESEVKVYDEYLTGNVYQYTIYEINTCDLGHEHKSVVESCGSFYDENDCHDEGLSVLKTLQGSEVEQ